MFGKKEVKVDVGGISLIISKQLANGKYPNNHCRLCTYNVPNNFGYGSSNDLCLNKPEITPDLVTGELSIAQRNCSIERKYDLGDHCGSKGRYFTPRKSE